MNIKTIAITTSIILLTSCGGGGGSTPTTSGDRSCDEGKFTYILLDDGVTGEELYKTNGEADCTTLIQDINKNSSSSADDRQRWDLGNGTIIFKANDGINGSELWSHNANGTSLVFDHNVDGNISLNTSKVIEGGDSLGSGLPLNGRLYYVIDSPNDSANELWTTDGTEQGTYMLYSSTSINQLIAFNNEVYFTSFESGINSLWKTDGSIIGTVEFSVNKTSNPFVLNSKLYYIVDNITLVQTDGTNNGTFTIGSIPSGTIISMIAVNNALLMTVSTDTGSFLYKSDGTTAPNLLTGLNTVANSGVVLYRFSLTSANIFFTAINENGALSLWKSDGTENGTINFGVINENNNPSARFFTEFNGKTYFQANDGINGAELWEINGNVLSMVDLDDTTESRAYDFTVLDNALYFIAKDSMHGFQLWAHNGSQALKVTDTFVPYGTKGLQDLVAYRNSLYFIGSDSEGSELWKSDGSTSGTVRVTNINPFGDSIYIFGDLHIFDDLLYFEANDGVHGRELWKSDGTTVNTEITFDINQKNIRTDLRSLFTLNNNDYVFANDGASQALWAIDDTGIVIVKRIPGDAIINQTQEHNGFVYFVVVNSALSDGIWRTDGTANNTTRILDSTSLNPANVFYTTGLASYNGEFYFLSQHATNGFGLYKLRALDNELTLVKTLNPTGSSSRRFGIIIHQNKMFFNADDGVNGQEIWVSDGTTDGTRILFDPSPVSGVTPSLLTATDTKLYFSVFVNPVIELWESDGETAVKLDSGFLPLQAKELNNSVYFLGVQELFKGTNTTTLYKYDGAIFTSLHTFDQRPGQLVRYNGKLYFEADDPVNPDTHSALWVSDGTVEGTKVLKSIFVKEVEASTGEIRPYVQVPNGIDEIEAAGDRLYFSFFDAEHGNELWVSDGTEEGTHIVKDIVPGPVSGISSEALELIRDHYQF